MKRNKPAAVILSEEVYAQLIAKGTPKPSGMTAFAWLLERVPAGRRKRAEIDADLDAERSW